MHAPRWASMSGGATTATVLDATGRVMLTQRTGTALGANVGTIDTSGLPDGFYVLMLENHGARQQAAFVKAK